MTPDFNAGGRMRITVLIGLLVIASGCVTRTPVRTAPVPTVTTRVDSMQIAAVVFSQLVQDSLLVGDLRRALARLDSVAADTKANPRRYVKLQVF
jgi:hypothetical protein